MKKERSSIEVLVDFVNSVIPIHVFLFQPRILMVPWVFSLKVASNCLLNPLLASGFLMISTTW